MEDLKPVNPTEDTSRAPKIDALLMPSWLSGLVAIIAGLIVTVGVVIVFSFNNSQIQQQLTGLQTTSTPSLTLPGEKPPGSNKSSLQNTWPLLGFWAVIGLVVYFIVETITQGLHNVEELREEMNYVHAQRDVLIKTAVEYLLIRLVVVIVWLFFIEVFFRRIIPYSILAAHASAADILSLQSVLYIFVSFFMIAASLHLHTIFLRLSLRRTRVFSVN